MSAIQATITGGTSSERGRLSRSGEGGGGREREEGDGRKREGAGGVCDGVRIRGRENRKGRRWERRTM